VTVNKKIRTASQTAELQATAKRQVRPELIRTIREGRGGQENERTGWEQKKRGEKRRRKGKGRTRRARILAARREKERDWCTEPGAAAWGVESALFFSPG
jgi:hypothetical protein